MPIHHAAIHMHFPFCNSNRLQILGCNFTPQLGALLLEKMSRRWGAKHSPAHLISPLQLERQRWHLKFEFSPQMLLEFEIGFYLIQRKRIGSNKKKCTNILLQYCFFTSARTPSWTMAERCSYKTSRWKSTNGIPWSALNNLLCHIYLYMYNDVISIYTNLLTPVI